MGPIRPGFRSFCQQMKQILDRNFFGHGLQYATEYIAQHANQTATFHTLNLYQKKGITTFWFHNYNQVQKGQVWKISLFVLFLDFCSKKASLFFLIHRHNQTPSVQGKPSHGTPVRSCPTIWFAIGARILVVVWLSKSGCTVPGTRYRANGLIIEMIMELGGIGILQTSQIIMVDGVQQLWPVHNQIICEIYSHKKK